MTRLYLLLAILFIQSMNVFSQNSLFTLHPALGDTIDQKEKKDFLLFPEIKYKDFRYGVIYKTADNYLLHIRLINDSLVARPLSQGEIDQTKTAIDKLQAYYLSETKIDSIKASNLKRKQLNNTLSNEQAPKIGIDEEFKEKAGAQGRRRQRLKQAGIDSGLRGQDLEDYQSLGGSAEIRFKKKKK